MLLKKKKIFEVTVKLKFIVILLLILLASNFIFFDFKKKI
jgi:hypothetical protein